MAETIIDWINKNGGYNKEKLLFPMGAGAIYISYKDVVDMSEEEFLKPEKARFAPSIEDPVDEYARDAYDKEREEKDRIRKEKETADRLKRDQEREEDKKRRNIEIRKSYLARSPDGTFHNDLYGDTLYSVRGGEGRRFLISRKTLYAYANTTREDFQRLGKLKTADADRISSLTAEDKTNKESILTKASEAGGSSWIEIIDKSTGYLFDKDDPSKRIGTYSRKAEKIIDLEGKPLKFNVAGKGIPTSQFHSDKKLLLYPYAVFIPEISFAYDAPQKKYREYFDENGNIYIQLMEENKPKNQWKKVAGNFVDLVNSGEISFKLKYDEKKSSYPFYIPYARFVIVASKKEFNERITPLIKRTQKLKEVLESGKYAGDNSGGALAAKKRVNDALVKYNESEPEYDLYKVPNYSNRLVYLNKPSGLVYYPELRFAGYNPSNPISKIPYIRLAGYLNTIGELVLLYSDSFKDKITKITEKDMGEDAEKIEESIVQYKRERRLGEQPRVQESLKEIGDKAKKTLDKEDKWVDGARKMVLDAAEEDYEEMKSKDYNANKRLKRSYERNVALWKEQHPDEELRRIYKSGVREMERIEIEAPPPKAPPKAKPPPKEVENIRLEIAEPEAPPPKNLVINRRPPPPPPDYPEPDPPADPEPAPAQPVGGVRCKEILGQQSTCLDKQVGKPTMEKLSRVSNFKTVQRKANQLLGDRFEGKVPLELSTRSGKKYMIGIPGTRRKVHFGDLIREDFTKHNNQKRLNDFRRRNAKWANASWDTPMWLSYNLLW